MIHPTTRQERRKLEVKHKRVKQDQAGKIRRLLKEKERLDELEKEEQVYRDSHQPRDS
jgi:hypothetical protein